MKMAALVRAFALCLATGSSLAGSEIIIGPTIGSSSYSLSGYEVAVSFTPSAAEMATGIMIAGAGGPITLSLEADASGSPSGTPLSGGTATGTLSDGTVLTTLPTVLSAGLIAGNQYWVVLSTTGSSTTITASTTPVTTGAGEVSFDGGNSWNIEPTGSGYYLPSIVITGNDSSAPEPETGALMGFSALFAVFWVRRSKGRGRADLPS